MRGCRTCIIMLALIGWSVGTAGAEPPPGFITFKVDTFSAKLDEIDVTLPHELAMKIQLKEGAAEIDLWGEADLSDLQLKTPGMLQGDKKNEECGDRLDVFDVSLVPAGNSARLCGQIRYERWYCTYAKVPEFKGIKVTFKERQTSKNKVLSQSGRICTELWPVVEADGRSVRLDGDVQKVDLSGALGIISDALGLEGLFKDQIRGSLRTALAQVQASIPDEFSRYQPVLKSMRFVERSEGRLGVVAEAAVTVDQNDLEELQRLLSPR
ncbi:hypothetical protein EDC22_10323 [Tepidamorphus gemmatus]|uniref:DUF4403 family protein n=2 Tax=Tepidamorphus gemmatus TaxID=747076 RepID=A0A4R3MD94_9HYPH|nr:hypothetical protein EDC22_10323 [Tepidamorphus gemmatus]